MKAFVNFSLIFVVLFFSSQACAADSNFNRSADKLLYGITNVATGILELPKNVILYSQNNNPVYGITTGTLTGIMHTVGRTALGVLDIATFLVPSQPSVKPSPIWKDFSIETTY